MTWAKSSTYGLDSDPAIDWQRRAACLDEDPELFFPVSEKASAARLAKQVCAGCPVRVECLTAGGREAFGVWGGLTSKERRRVSA